METIVIIPARGNSKGIPRKNVRYLGKMPLISHVCKAAKEAKLVDQVIVTTDDEEIAYHAKQAGALVHHRTNPELSNDSATLDGVIFDALQGFENQHGQVKYVVTCQPTSPLLRASSIDNAIQILKAGGTDTVISVKDTTHLSWTKSPEGEVQPLYKERVNRQWLPPTYSETGAVLASRREVVLPKSRIGKKIQLMMLSRGEAIDIDDPTDWAIAETFLNRQRFAFVVCGNHQLGTGHVYRVLALAARLTGHELHFIAAPGSDLAIQLLQGSNYVCQTPKNEAELVQMVAKIAPHTLINDILDTSSTYMKALRPHCQRLINFEDLGEGTKEADLVINALYDGPLLDHVKSGLDYFSLRSDVAELPPYPFRDPAKCILLAFGGTDPSNLTSKTLAALQNYLQDKVDSSISMIRILLGPAFTHHAELEPLLGKSQSNVRLEVIQNTRAVAQLIHEADLAFTSAGRTALELAAVGVPTVVMAQNNRELTHTFATSDNGYINLGLGSLVSPATIANTCTSLLENVEFRRQHHERLIKNDVRGGTARLLRLLLP